MNPSGGFNFSGFGQAPTFGQQAATTTAPATTTSAFSFSAPNAAPPTFGGGLTFGATTSAPLSFSTGAATAQGPSFGMPSNTPPAFGATTFGTQNVALPGATTSAATSTFGTPASAAPAFGTQASAAPAFGTPASTAPTFGTPASAAPAFGTPASTGLTFGSPAPAPIGATFGAAPIAASTAAPNTGFALPSSTTLSFGTPPSTSAAPLSFGQKTQQPATTTSALSFGAAAKPTLPTLPTFGVPAATTSAPTLAPAAATTAPISLGLSTNVIPTPGFTTSTTTTQSSAASANQLTFSQIEELINKYTLELEEQEKLFINQATQVNTWDNLLNNNSKKIVELSNAVEKVKSDQKCLEDELKFIETQHTELEECITPLKKELDKVPHGDVERAQTYTLAENLDTQLRQMSEDLKEVIEHLNEVSKLQNSNDPIVQIGRILNAHMTSLQWIELSTSQINVKLEDINKLYDTLRRDTERSLRLTYYD